MATRREVLRGLLGALVAPAAVKASTVTADPLSPVAQTAPPLLSAIDADLGAITAGRIVARNGSCEVDFDAGVFRIRGRSKQKSPGLLADPGLLNVG